MALTISPLVSEFIKARDYLNDIIEDRLIVYFSDVWDPLCKFVLIKEIHKIIEKELEHLYPSLPKTYLPKCKLKVGDYGIEVGLQSYFNSQKDLIFLGHRGLNDEEFDLYCKPSYDPTCNYYFVARYGHLEDEYYEGGKQAASQYMIGQFSPLSLAYELAIEEGYVN